MSPVHNHCFLGNEADRFSVSTPEVSLGFGTDFESFYRNDFQLILLGIDFQKGATYLHHIEASVNVPYREWIRVNRKVVLESGSEPIDVKTDYFVRKDKDYTSTSIG